MVNREKHLQRKYFYFNTLKFIDRSIFNNFSFFFLTFLSTKKKTGKKNFEIEIDKCNSLLDYYQDIIIPSELSDYNPYEHETHLKLLNDKTNIDLLKYTNEYSKLKHIMLVELTFFNKLKKIQMDYEEYLNNLEKATLTPTNNMNDDASLSLNIENINESIENLEKEIASSNLNYKIDAVNLSSGSSSRQDDVSTASSTQTSRKNSKNSFDTSFKEIKSAREPLTQKSIINDDLNETRYIKKLKSIFIVCFCLYCINALKLTFEKYEKNVF